MNAKSHSLGERGFTLIEVLTVMGLTVMLLLLVIPAFMRGLPRLRLRSAADQVASDVMLARSLAIERRTTGSLTWNPSAARYVLEPLGRSRSLPRDVNVSAFPAVSFGARGLLEPPTAVVVSLSSADGTRLIKVSPAGQVRVEVSP